MTAYRGLQSLESRGAGYMEDGQNEIFRCGVFPGSRISSPVTEAEAIAYRLYPVLPPLSGLSLF